MRIEAKAQIAAVQNENLLANGRSPSDPSGSDEIDPTLVKNAVNGVCPFAFQSSSSNSHLHHGPVKMPVKISNITTSHQLNDVLHQRSKVITRHRVFYVILFYFCHFLFSAYCLHKSRLCRSSYVRTK